MVKIEWTEEAVFWLKEIYNKVQILSSFPQIGYSYPNEKDLNIRILLYGHYRIAYLIKETNNISILGVFHSALDIQRYLK